MDNLLVCLRIVGNGVVQLYKAVEFTINGVTFNFFDILLWGLAFSALVYFLIKLTGD